MKQWLEYYSRAKTIYQTHSPFLYDIYVNVLRTDRQFYAFSEIEKVRKMMKKGNQQIRFIELGAGSKVLKGNTRKVREIAGVGISKVNQCRILFNAVNHLAPQHILELGTSLGLSTLYMACARKHSVIDTVEGNEDLVHIARANAHSLSLDNIRFHNMSIDDFIGSIHADTQYDLVFMDANHTYEATIQYFEQLLPFLSPRCTVIVDDIHWSYDMFRAWEDLKRHQKVRATIETAHFGFLFMNGQYPMTNHTLIDYWCKPWQIGLFPQDV